MVRAAVAGVGGGMRAARARAGLEVSAPLLLGVVLAAVVCYPFAGGRLLLLDFVSGPHQPVLPAAAFGLDGGLTGGSTARDLLAPARSPARAGRLGRPGGALLPARCSRGAVTGPRRVRASFRLAGAAAGCRGHQRLLAAAAVARGY